MSAVAVDAATVMLLRPSSDATVKDIEVLLVLRNRKSSFVPGYYVFPGGVVDPEDYEPDVERFIRGIDRGQAARMFPDMTNPGKSLGAWVAGIRETFEEAGILIARRSDGTPVTMAAHEERVRFGAYRKALLAGQMTFSQILEAENLTLAADSLHYYSRWVTPELMPQRYDVRFFVARVPAGQSAASDGVELTAHSWLRPAAALKDYEEGRIGMVLPQIATLEELSGFRTVEETISFARNRLAPSTLTKIVWVDGKAVEVMPDGSVFENRPPVYPPPGNKR